jgi:hypothetical protein
MWGDAPHDARATSQHDRAHGSEMSTSGYPEGRMSGVTLASQHFLLTTNPRLMSYEDRVEAYDDMQKVSDHAKPQPSPAELRALAFIRSSPCLYEMCTR